MRRLTRFLRHRFVEHVELRADVVRASRATVAFGVPLAVCHWLDAPAEAIFISMAALNLSLPDLRGAYRVRVGILATMILVAVSSAWLGVCCAGSTLMAVAAMGVVAILGGVWRHLSADYGPSLAVSSGLLFLLGLSQPGGESAAFHLAEWTGLGGIFAALLHGCAWAFRPQHALRSAVAETWVAAADLAAAMRPGAAGGTASHTEAIARQERELRAALDRTFVVLGGAENRKPSPLVARLEEMRREVVHLTMRLIALNASLESMQARPDFAPFLPVVDSVLKAVSDAARSVAITLIMHRAENLAASNLRLRRGQHLIKAADEQLAVVPGGGTAIAQVRAALAQIAGVLPRILAGLRQTADSTVPRLTFSAGLPDLSARSIRSLGAWMRPASQADPVIIRHAVRMAVFTMFAVGLYEGFGVPRGYWIAFSILVVLQPDYGSTRQRAAARIGGTVGGSVLAGILLWVKMPLFLLDGLAMATAFAFAYFLKRRYGLAILFVTINLMLVTETVSGLQKDFMVLRVLSTLAGGGLALVAARVFWPVWEGEKFPTLLAEAIGANRTFLLSLSPSGGPPPTAVPAPLMARRRAENANRYVAVSVERLLGEPAGRPEIAERAAALATYCQRITRALTALAVQSPEGGTLANPAVAAVIKSIADLLDRMAKVVQTGCEPSAVEGLRADLGTLEADFARAQLPAENAVPAPTLPAMLVRATLAKTVAELAAMTLALRLEAPAAQDNAENPTATA